jgi:hypothetical protein
MIIEVKNDYSLNIDKFKMQQSIIEETAKIQANSTV